MKIKNLKIEGKVLTNKEQKTIKGGRGCGCTGGGGNGNPHTVRPCHEC